MNDRKPKVTGTMGALRTSRSSTNFPAYSFTAGPRGRTSEKTILPCPFDTSDDIGDEAFNEDCAQKPGKKRRLTLEQVKSLEINFDLVNKLDPERKMQMANELGLQPRQVAIWFQNRRARWKTKKLEKDYDALKSEHDSLRTKYDSLLQDKEKIRAQLLCLKEKIQSNEMLLEHESTALEMKGECAFNSRSSREVGGREMMKAEESVDEGVRMMNASSSEVEARMGGGHNNIFWVCRNLDDERNFISELLWDWDQ